MHIEMHSARIFHPKHFPVIGNQERTACQIGHYTGSEGSVDLAKALSAFYRPSTKITRCISLVLRGTPGIIALRFCSDIRRTITSNCMFPKGWIVIHLNQSSRVDQTFLLECEIFFIHKYFDL